MQALAAVLRAIDNPADRLSLVQALRSPFFAVSDADLFHFVSTKGVLNINAPQGDEVAKREVFDPIFKLLARLHRLRRIESPSVIVEELFARTSRADRIPDEAVGRADGGEPVEGARDRARLRGGGAGHAARVREVPAGRGGQQPR